MIVPFLFNLYDMAEEYTFLDMFYKYINFCLESNMPIIVQERFTKKIDFYKKINHSATNERWQFIQKYKLPTDKEIDEVKKYIIADADIKKILKKYKNKDACAELMKNVDTELCDIIENIVKKIGPEKIKCFIVSLWNPSLAVIAKKYNIKIINTELAPARPFNYNDTFGYFQFCNKYDSKYITKVYNDFKLTNNHVILSRKELILLLLSTSNLKYIKLLYESPIYDLGYALGMKDDKYEKIYVDMTYKDVTNKLKKIYCKNQVLLRPHPAIKEDKYDDFYKLDDSNNTFEWIGKCKNIICSVSNVGFEAMLFGRGVTHIFEGLPTAFNKKYNLDFIDDSVVGLEKLNFLTFGVYVPYDILYDLNYIKWRLEDPSIEEIYNKNLEYIFKKNNIDIKKYINKSLDDRMKLILKKVHNYSDEEADKFINELYVDKEQQLLEENQQLKNELNRILNSKGWKLLEKIRKIKG